MLSITLFVNDDATTGGDGLGWGTAYDDLQAALTDAATRNTDQNPDNNVDSIWIAEGTYQSANAFAIRQNGLSIYGGFAGTETSLALRPGITAPTEIYTGE